MSELFIMTNKKHLPGLSALGYRCCVLAVTVGLALLVSAQEAKQVALRQRLGRVLTPEEKARVLADVKASDDIDRSLSVALLDKGLGLFVEKEYEQCVPYLEEALTLDPSLLSGWEGLGWAYWRLDEKELAKELWQSMRQLVPNEVMPYTLLAQVAVLEKDWKLADEYFRKALILKQDQYEVRFWFAQNLLRIGKYKESERIVRALIREDSGRVDVQILLARMMMYQQSFDEAAELWRKILKELPDNADLLLEQAYVELQVGEIQRADDLCVKVLELSPKNLRAMMFRADLADISDMADLTITRLQELIELNQDPQTRAGLRIRLATRCKLINERKAEAPYSDSYILDQYALAVKDDPLNVSHRVAFAEACVMSQRYGQARELAIEVLEKFNKNNIRAKDILFQVELAEGHYDRADQVLEARYNGYGKNDPERFYRRAEVMVARGRFEEAVNLLDMMDKETSGACVLTLLYHQLTESDWIPLTSVRRLHEHLSALKQEGFEMISPAAIPEVFKKHAASSSNRVSSASRTIPWPAQIVDSIRYAFTAERRFQSVDAQAAAEAWKVSKYVSVTFDDGARSAFKLATSVAQDFNVPFGMFVITKEAEDFEPMYASWNEILEYASSGFWVMGSHLEEAHTLTAVSADPADKRHALANRVWLPEKGRLESMNEWDKRMRNNFRHSRMTIKEKMGEHDGPVAMVAYPYGDVGQDEASNITALRNPIQSIISEASRSSEIGFVQSASGYSCAGDDRMLLKRYEPMWFDEGADVVRSAYRNHPVFMARRLRVEIAYRQNKPYLAKDMVALMRRDGYPAEWCREMEVETYAHFTHKPVRKEKPLIRDSQVTTAPPLREQRVNREAVAPASGPDTYSPEQRSMGAANSGTMPERPSEVIQGEERPSVALNSPYLGGEIWDSKANGEFSQTRYGVRGGLNLNRRSALSAEFFTGTVKQRTTLSTANPDYDAGQATSRSNFVYFSSNAVYRAKREDIRFRYSYTFDSGAVLSMSLGQATFKADKKRSSDFYLDRRDGQYKSRDYSKVNDDAFIGDIAYTFYPLETVLMRTYYIHDVASSGYELLEYDSIGFNSRWMISDQWYMGLTGQYWIYDDDNSLGYAQLDSFWEIDKDLHLWVGAEGMVTSAAQKNSYYWTPYWDTRINMVLRYREDYPGYFFNFDAIVGFQREDARPNDELSGGQKWEPGVGFAGSYQRRIWNSFDWFIDARTMFLHSYIDHSFRIGGIYNF